MSNRRQPFGYRICNGKVAANKAEEEIVKYIFRAYIGGASYNDIKRSLHDQPVSYDGDRLWNKNMIARILGDRRYTGTDVYPPILSCEEFEAAETVRASKVQIDTRTEAQRLLYKLSDRRPAVKTETEVLGIINALIQNPSFIVRQQQVPEDNETIQLQKKFEDQLLIQPMDKMHMKKLIVQIAAAQYSAVDGSGYETARLQRILSQCKPMEHLDAEVLVKLVDKVIVQKATTLVVMRNGQTISAEDVL